MIFRRNSQTEVENLPEISDLQLSCTSWNRKPAC